MIEGITEPLTPLDFAKHHFLGKKEIERIQGTKTIYNITNKRNMHSC